MFTDVIILSALIVVLFILWIGLKLNARVRLQKIRDVKGARVDLAAYVNFAQTFNLAEEEERKGNLKLARFHFQRALELLEQEEEPDQLTRETIAEVKQRLASLDSLPQSEN